MFILSFYLVMIFCNKVEIVLIFIGYLFNTIQALDINKRYIIEIVRDLANIAFISYL